MSKPLMPKATAVWLVENTALTFDQIAEFCGLHHLEVQGIADGEIATGMQGLDPIANSQLTKDEIKRCEADSTARMRLAKQDLPQPAKRTKGPRYTPVAKRQDKPNGVAWLLRNYPEVSDAQISKLIGTTKNTIQSVRERTHWNMANIQPRDPVLLGLCGQGELNAVIEKAQRAAERARKAAEKEAAKAEAKLQAEVGTPPAAEAAPEVAAEPGADSEATLES
ncbi:MAG: DUF1013 domain-containing protein [Kiloniellales bacterium]|nr:DUF1013 domain-containing protein [Kiloniellales bacterium]